MPEPSLHSGAAIRAMLDPASIAIAGASTDRTKLGSLPLAFLQRHGYAGRIYPIHPKEAEIAGIRCYRSIADIDADIDLLVVAIGAARVIDLFDECREGQVKAAIVLSSGFAEIGGEGVALQRKLRDAALAKGIRFIGPNSVGSANMHRRVMPSISQVFDEGELAAGVIGFVSQSGAVGTAITALSAAERIGIGYFLSTGNEGDLEFGDFVDAFADDPSVRIIAGYVESIRDGDKFRRAAIKAARAAKPVALIKVGASDAGGKAVQSHTGALAGAEDVYRAAFAELGIIRSDSIEGLIDVLKVCASFIDRRTRGRRIAVLSHSGGAGVLMADTCVAEGLDVAAPSPALVGKLKARLPSYASFQNPIDMTANVIFDPALMADTVRDVVESGEYDAVLLCVNLIWRQGDALAAELAKLRQAQGALVGVAWIAAKPGPRAVLDASGVPVFGDPVRCVRAFAARLRWEAGRERVARANAPDRGPSPRREPRPDVASDRTSSVGAPTEPPAVSGNDEGRHDDLGRFAVQQALLSRYGIPLARCRLVATADEAQAAARALGFPVAAKIIARDLAHKSELGGVRLGLSSDAAVADAIRALAGIHVAWREGFLVQKMIAGPLEVFCGMKRDGVFGPVVVVGLGGIYVEILRETVMMLAPFDANAAAELLSSAKFHPLLAGARGRAKLDVAALARIIAAVSALAVDEPDVVSLDLNPIIVGEAGATVVDFKFERAPAGAPEAPLET